jgi:hypothetical protein
VHLILNLILYSPWPLALAEPNRIHLHPVLEALAGRDGSEPLVRFACALALYAFEIHVGLIDGPFDQARAERYARELLMPADDFMRLAGLTDSELAALFGVPVEQVWARRLELARPSAGREAAP